MAPAVTARMLRPIRLASVALAAFAMPALAQDAQTAADLAPGQDCAFVTQASADASAGIPNVAHDGSPLPGISPPDISQGFRGIPRSAQPPLTASQRRILECTYLLPEAGVEKPYTLFIPSRYDPARPTPLVVDLHGELPPPGTEVVLFGAGDRGEPTAQDWAEAIGTISYEIVTRIGGRFARRHVDTDDVDTDESEEGTR